jgi:hypothetical protein
MQSRKLAGNAEKVEQQRHGRRRYGREAPIFSKELTTGVATMLALRRVLN